MSLDEAFSILRQINVALITLTALFLGIRFLDLLATAGRGAKFVFGGIVAYFLVGGSGSVEAYLQDAAVGWRIPGATVACILILIGLWESRHNPWLPKPEPKCKQAPETNASRGPVRS